MKTLIIKTGKAINVLKRDGVVNGASRIWTAFWKQFQFVRPGDVLIVTNGVGDSALYRAHHQAEELREHGIKASVGMADNPLLARHAEKFKVFVFHRVLYTPGIAKFLQKIKKAGKEIVFETDDLVYDPQYLRHMDYFQKMNALERKLYENGVGGEILNDPYVKVCTTTTSFLAEKLREKGKRVFVVPNKLSKEDVRVADEILKANEAKEANEAVRIGYFSGTLSHNKDFATITEALVKIMEKYENTELFLVGPLDIESGLNKFADRIKQLPYVPREKHFANIAKMDINLAPLEIGNPFCEAKSELKFFEAGAVRVPTIAARTKVFCKAITEGKDGLLAGSFEEWESGLARLIEDGELRRTIGENAYVTAMEKYATTGKSNEEYLEFLRGKIG